MTLFDHAVIAFSSSNVGFYDLASNEPTRRIHLLLTEYAKHEYFLLVCELAKGDVVCDQPPKVAHCVPLPNQRLNFKFDASFKSIEISIPLEWTGNLVFHSAADFWEMVRKIAEINGVDVLHRATINGLVGEALATIPTVRHDFTSPTDGSTSAAVGKDGAEDEGAQVSTGAANAE